MKPRIHLIVERTDGRGSNMEIEISGESVTADMLDVADDLLHTLTTGERPVLKGFYELCANAFGTTRDDAKKRLLGALYGRKEAGSDVRSAIKKTDWSWPPLHNIPTKKKS